MNESELSMVDFSAIAEVLHADGLSQEEVTPSFYQAQRQVKLAERQLKDALQALELAQQEVKKAIQQVSISNQNLLSWN